MQAPIGGRIWPPVRRGVTSPRQHNAKGHCQDTNFQQYYRLSHGGPDPSTLLAMFLTAHSADLRPDLDVTQRYQSENNRRYDVDNGHLCLPSAKGALTPGC
jgi:hypothetical protein